LICDIIGDYPGSLNPLMALPLFIGALAESYSYENKLKSSMDEIKSTHNKLHEV